MTDKIDAAILAGGQNSRMNHFDKSQLSYKGETFLDNILRQMSDFEKIMIISNSEKNKFLGINAEIHKDLIKNIGPLGGIYTALRKTEARHIFVTSCDMPLISRENIGQICSFNEYDIVMPVHKGKYEMLFALYSKKCLPGIEKLIDEKRYKIIGLLEDPKLKIHKISVDRTFLKSLQNINTESEYKALIEKYR